MAKKLELDMPIDELVALSVEEAGERYLIELAIKKEFMKDTEIQRVLDWLFKNANFKHNNNQEFLFWIPFDEPTFITRFGEDYNEKEIPIRIWVSLRAAYEISQREIETRKDAGYVLIYMA
jgi:hypothetical protein